MNKLLTRISLFVLMLSCVLMVTSCGDEEDDITNYTFETEYVDLSQQPENQAAKLLENPMIRKNQMAASLQNVSAKFLTYQTTSTLTLTKFLTALYNLDNTIATIKVNFLLKDTKSGTVLNIVPKEISTPVSNAE